SKCFFNKSADDVTLAEAARLVGIPKGPTYYSPLNDEERSHHRQQIIVDQLRKEETISKQDYLDAIDENLVYTVQQESQTKNIAPYFQDVVIKEAANILQLDHAFIKSSGYHIYTTLNTHFQQQLEQIVHKNIKENSELQTGVISLNPHTGAI